MPKARKIVLFGYSSFGRQLYKNLSILGHRIRVVSDLDAEFIQSAKEDGIDITKLNVKRDDDILALGIDPDEDLLYCAMNKTANNLFLVLTLRTLLPTANIIAISNSFENTRKLEYAGANSVIDLYEATSRRVVNILTRPAVTSALDEIIYRRNDLKMAEIVLPEKSFLEGRYVKEIQFRRMDIILIAIIDKELGHELIFTDHRIDHRLDAGDTLVVLAKREALKVLQDRIFDDQA